MKLLLTFLLSAFVLVSCIEPIKLVESNDTTLLRTDSLIRKQKEVLIGKRVEKTIVWNEDQEIQNVVLDSTSIHQMLEIALNPSLNYHLSSYKYREENTDFNRKYSRDQEESKGLKSLEIHWNDNNKITEIVVVQSEKNLLFDSNKKMTLKFNPTSGELNEYYLEGYQNLIGLKPSVYAIHWH